MVKLQNSTIPQVSNPHALYYLSRQYLPQHAALIFWLSFSPPSIPRALKGGVGGVIKGVLRLNKLSGMSGTLTNYRYRYLWHLWGGLQIVYLPQLQIYKGI